MQNILLLNILNNEKYKNNKINLVYIKNIYANKIGLIISFDNFVISKVG